MDLTMVSFLIDPGFKGREGTTCGLGKSNKFGNAEITIGLFLDDMIITGTSHTSSEELVTEMENMFKLKVTETDDNGCKSTLKKKETGKHRIGDFNSREHTKRRTSTPLSIHQNLPAHNKKLSNVSV